MLFHHHRVPREDVYRLLSNPRRRRALEYLTETPTTTVGELADAVAAAETAGAVDPSVRTAVYVSLRQSHLPRLHDAGVVAFDPETNAVELLGRARGVTMYMELVTRYGITWAEFYQYLGLLSLLAVLASLLDVPGIALVPPLVWTTAFLVAFAASGLYQLWNSPLDLRRHLRS